MKTPLSIQDAGHGYDLFGMSARTIQRAMALLHPLYKYYFRVTNHGIEHIPSSGAAILAANHSGTLPLDAVMLYSDVAYSTSPTRLPRAITDHFVPSIPFLSTFFARMGTVGGTRENVRHLLENGELLMIFPEGTVGIGKPFSKRYQLQPWRMGHVELAIRHRAPIIPVAIIGAEEQMPQLMQLPIGAFGSPYLPIPATPIPFPVHLQFHYGEPIALHEEYPPEAADDPAIVAEGALRVQSAVQALIDRGLTLRKGIFR